MSKIYLVRHGQTIFNHLNKVQGWCDSPLTEAGVQGAIDCGKGLSNIKFEQAYSSDLRRAETTLKLILQENQSIPNKIESEPALRELCFGDYEGRFEDERKIACAKVLLGHDSLEIMNEKLKAREILPDKMMNAIHSIDTSGYAETYEEVQERAIAKLQEIAKNCEANGGGNILVVSHGVTIVSVIDALPGKKLQKVSDMKNMSVTVLDYSDDKLTVEKVASMEYVENK